MPDAVATTTGAAFGTSTVTCYIDEKALRELPKAGALG